MIALYIVISIFFNFDITSIVNVFMLSIEKKRKKEEPKETILNFAQCTEKSIVNMLCNNF